MQLFFFLKTCISLNALFKHFDAKTLRLSQVSEHFKFVLKGNYIQILIHYLDFKVAFVEQTIPSAL